MSVKYVEAMILKSDVMPDRIRIGTTYQSMERVWNALPEVHLINTPLERAALELSNDADELLTEVRSHECPTGIGVGLDLVPLSHTDSVGRQLETALFLPGDEVAIVRLADLKTLISKAVSYDARAVMPGTT